MFQQDFRSSERARTSAASTTFTAAASTRPRAACHRRSRSPHTRPSSSLRKRAWCPQSYGQGTTGGGVVWPHFQGCTVLTAVMTADAPRAAPAATHTVGGWCAIPAQVKPVKPHDAAACPRPAHGGASQALAQGPTSVGAPLPPPQDESSLSSMGRFRERPRGRTDGLRGGVAAFVQRGSGAGGRGSR